MLGKRIIPCLDVRNGRTVKGVKFVDLRDAGDAVALARQYARAGADEVVFLDITASHERRRTAADFAAEVGQALDIPFTIGGGVHDAATARDVLYAGADKIAINSAAVANPQLIDELAGKLGSQAVVLSIDAMRQPGGWSVCTHGGRRDSGIEVSAWVEEAQARGVGEILLTSIAADGTRQGFDLELLRYIRPLCHVPLIASGGAGGREDFLTLFEDNLADAGLAASLFHFNDLSIPALKTYLHNHGISVRPC